MDELEIEAMLIRKEAVMSTAVAIGLDGDGIGMLVAIIFPDDNVLAASRKRAEQTGPSPLARRLAKKRREPAKPKKKKKRPKPLPDALPENPTIDEMLSDLY